jgi:hypothetical protein
MSNPNILSAHNDAPQDLFASSQTQAWETTDRPGIGYQPGPLNPPVNAGLPATVVQFFIADTYQAGGSITIPDYSEGVYFSDFELTPGIAYLLTASIELTGNQNPGSTYAFYNATDENWIGYQRAVPVGQLLQETITPLVPTTIQLIVSPPEGQGSFKIYDRVINAKVTIQAIGIPA